jgi:hypothetical protein
MDQVDARQAHMISTEYDLREQGQKLLLLPDDEQNAKRIKRIEHSKTKGQVDMMGVLLKLWGILTEARPLYPVFPITKSKIFPATSSERTLKRTLQTDTNISLSQRMEIT